MPLSRLTFQSAAGAGIGTCLRRETDQGQSRIDCRVFQQSRTEKEFHCQRFPCAPDAIAAVILSHPPVDPLGQFSKRVRHACGCALAAASATTTCAGATVPDRAHSQNGTAIDALRRSSLSVHGTVQAHQSVNLDAETKGRRLSAAPLVARMACHCEVPDVCRRH
jgi:metallo-beta-lactamase family protein